MMEHGGETRGEKAKDWMASSMRPRKILSVGALQEVQQPNDDVEFR